MERGGLVHQKLSAEVDVVQVPKQTRFCRRSRHHSGAEADAILQALLDFEALENLEAWLARLELTGAELLARLRQQFGVLAEERVVQVQGLSRVQLERLAGAAEAMGDIAELQDWLEQHPTGYGAANQEDLTQQI